MSGLAVRNQNGEAVHYTGSQFSGLENTGTHHLCIRTGTGADDVVKYGLTSTPLNDKYKGLRMRIPDHAGGNGGRDAYIAQRYSVSESASSSKTYTASRVSNYVSSTTLRTASSSRLSTYTATRSTTDGRSYYHGTTPVKTTALINRYLNTKGSYQADISIYGHLNIKASTFTGTSVSGWLLDYPTCFSAYVVIETKALTTLSTTIDEYYNQRYICSVNFSTIGIIDTKNTITNNRKLFTMEEKAASTSTQYTVSRTLSTASSSKLSTGNATRSSAYNTSSSMSTTSSKLTHNVNL